MVTKPNDFVTMVNGQNEEDPSSKHFLYLKHHEQVRLVDSIFEGIDDAKEHIFQFPQEIDKTFKTRKDRATLRNFVKRSVEAFVGMIFRKPLQVADYGPKVMALLPTIDTTNSIYSFTEQLATALSKDSIAYILADSPREQEDGAAPYLVLVERNSLINWRKDAFGKYTMIVIEEWVSVPRGQFGTQYIKQWRHYDEKGTIFIWRDNTYVRNPEPGSINTGYYIAETYETKFGFIPIKEVFIDNVPILYDTAKMNVKHMNRQSHKDRYLTMAALPIPVIWGADIDDDDTQGKVANVAKPALVIGVDEAFAFTGGKDESDFQWRELSGSSIEALENDLNSITEDITTGILRAAEGSGAVQKTATEVQLLQAEASNRVTTIATAIEIGMVGALDMLAFLSNETIPEDARFNLSKDFNASLMGSDGARIVLESYLLGLVSTETFLNTLNEMELIDIGSAADEMLRIKEDTFKPMPKTMELSGGTDNRLKGAINKGDGDKKEETKKKSDK